MAEPCAGTCGRCTAARAGVSRGYAGKPPAPRPEHSGALRALFFWAARRPRAARAPPAGPQAPGWTFPAKRTEGLWLR